MADGHSHQTLGLAALVASTREWSEHSGRMVQSPIAFNAARVALGAEIARATGVELHIAEIAAGGFLNTPDDPMASFGDIWSSRNSRDQAKAVDALQAWMAPTQNSPRLALRPEPGEVRRDFAEVA